MLEKHICTTCWQPATWYYDPYYDEKVEIENYYCDSCVPRGCSCNQYCIVDWHECHTWGLTQEEIEKENIQILDRLDSEWRKLPCCEYLYNKEWYEKE